VELRVSRRARRHIEWHGGDLFVWFAALGQDLFQRVSTDRPDAIDFTRYEADGVAVYLQANYQTPSTVEVKKLLWPFGLEVTAIGTGWPDP
jgi:hypothetical protein